MGIAGSPLMLLWRMFYDGWHGLLRVLLISVIAYAALIILLRISGKRTLSKLNAFDLVVTVALGSCLATVLLSKDIALAEGVLALAMLVGLQFVLAWLSVRWGGFESAVKANPTLLFYRGQFMRDLMRRERVTDDEVLAAIRAEGFASLDEVEAVVLETTATFSVLRRRGEPAPDPSADRASTLRSVESAQRHFS